MTSENDSSPDPDTPMFDDDFIRGGAREPSADERSERAARAAAMHELEAQWATVERRDASRRRSHLGLRRSLRRLFPALLVAGVLLAVAWSQRSPNDSVHASDFVVDFDVTGAPTPQSATSDVPLGRPSPTAPSDSYEFVATQADGIAPVAYDPCRPIRYVVNDRTMPTGAAGVVEEAIQQMSAITGLRFEAEGPTRELPSTARNPFQEDRYGDRWAPVLIAWSDPTELPELDGGIAGIGGSAWVEVDGVAVYVSGMVGLDGPDFAEILQYSDGVDTARAIVLHELAHVVGLDHVDDPSQLMYPENIDQTGAAAGDRAGLVQLGQGACVPEL